MNLRNVCVLILMVVLAAGLQSTGYATTADLQAIVSGNASLMHQWSFEGADISTAGLDSAGGVDLVEALAGTGTIGYAQAGFDASSAAASTYNDPDDANFGGGNGASFHTNAGIAPPATFSWEMVIKTDYVPITSTPYDGYNLGYVLAHRPGAQRGYFLWQGSSWDAGGGAGGDSFTSLTGGWQSGEATVVPAVLAENNWYYLAGTYTVPTGIAGDPSQVDLYYADLTAGDTTLTHTSFANPGSYEVDVAGTFGIGGRYDNTPEKFPGMLDEVNLYGAALSQGQLEANLAALLIPEPSTFVLMALGALCLMIWRRK